MTRGVESIGGGSGRRLVLLGASNVVRGFPTLLTTARRAWKVPLDVLAAEGRGRSYGLPSSFLGRRLPGIVSSGLWRAWDERSPLPTSALLTDVGNDLMYGVAVEQLLAWVEACLRRIRDRSEEVLLTSVPLAALRHVEPWQFLLLRSVFFPQNKAVWAEMLPRIEALDEGLRRLASSYGATLIDARPAWYGFDPIHIRQSQWGAAWREITAAWPSSSPAEPIWIAPWSWLRSQFWKPEQWHFFGRPRRCDQPCAAFDDGTRVSLY